MFVLGMRIYLSLLLLIACAVVLPGGLVLLPLAHAKYRKLSGRTPTRPSSALASHSARPWCPSGARSTRRRGDQEDVNAMLSMVIV